MIKVTIIALGKLKEKYLRDATAEYEKRLSRYCQLDIVEIEPIRLPEKPSHAEIDAALEKEAQLIFKKIPKNSEVFALCVEGKQLSSEGLAQSVLNLSQQGRGIALIIGSYYGLSERVKQISQTRLSLSKMTFTHQMARLILCEQLYRAMKINNGEKYHK